MSEQELVFNVKELHVMNLACANCGHGTIFDFETRTIWKKQFPLSAPYATPNWKSICESS